MAAVRDTLRLVEDTAHITSGLIEMSAPRIPGAGLPAAVEGEENVLPSGENVLPSVAAAIAKEGVEGRQRIKGGIDKALEVCVSVLDDVCGVLYHIPPPMTISIRYDLHFLLYSFVV
jgi:hypothetical protein